MEVSRRHDSQLISTRNGRLFKAEHLKYHFPTIRAKSA
jgi:hypothetical protein